MLNHGIELVPVTDTSTQSADVAAWAQTVESWLKNSPEAADKPADAILDPQNLGMFAIAGSGEVVGYVSQRQVTRGLHEISSLVVAPKMRGQHIGTALLETYADDLQCNSLGCVDLTAITHKGSLGVFKRVGFEEYFGDAPTDSSDLHRRAQKTGKFLVMRTAQSIRSHIIAAAVWADIDRHRPPYK